MTVLRLVVQRFQLDLEADIMRPHDILNGEVRQFYGVIANLLKLLRVILSGCLAIFL